MIEINFKNVYGKLILHENFVQTKESNVIDADRNKNIFLHTGKQPRLWISVVPYQGYGRSSRFYHLVKLIQPLAIKI